MIGPLVTCHALRVTFSVDCLPCEISDAFFNGARYSLLEPRY